MFGNLSEKDRDRIKVGQLLASARAQVLYLQDCITLASYHRRGEEVQRLMTELRKATRKDS